MVTAVKFLKNPRLASSALSTKKAFLKSKGLSESEISRACQQAGLLEEDVSRHETTSMLMRPNPQTSWLVTLRDYANVILVLSSATYALHYLWKNFLRPWLKQQKTDEQLFQENIQITFKSIEQSMKALEETMTMQKSILEQLVQKSTRLEDNNNWRQEGQEIRSEIISLKGLLLSS